MLPPPLSGTLQHALCCKTQQAGKSFAASASDLQSFINNTCVAATGAVYGLASSLVVYHWKHRQIAEQRNYHEQQLKAMGCFFAIGVLTEFCSQRVCRPLPCIDKW